MYIGATGFANEDRTLPALLDEYLGAKMSIVPGYTGRGEVYLAMQRGEVDGWASTMWRKSAKAMRPETRCCASNAAPINLSMALRVPGMRPRTARG